MGNQASQSNTEQSSPKQPKIFGFKLPKKLLLLFGLIFGLLLIWTGFLIFQAGKKPPDRRELPEQKEPLDRDVKFLSQKVIAQVGNETLYDKDLNYKLSVYFPQVAKTSDSVPEEIKKKALDLITRDSLLLQAAADEDLINLNKKVFNAYNKDYRERNILLNSIEEKVNQKLVNWVKGEMISIWFKNIYTPKMGLSAARKITRAKMETIYNQLKTGKLATLKEAGEVIKNDSSLASIDPSYQGNAYVTFEIKQGEDFFIDPKIQKAAFSLPPGQLSEILVGQDQNPGSEFYDCNFIVMKVEENKLTGFKSFEDWFNQKSKKYEVEIKI